MRFYKNFWTVVLVIFLLGACTPTTVEEPVAVDETITQVGGKEYSQTQLEALGIRETDFTNRDGATTTYSGTPLITLLTDAGIDQP